MTGVTTAAIILAGGQSRRMGRDKALLPWPGHPVTGEHDITRETGVTFVDHLVSVLRDCCSEIVLVARDAVQAATYRLPGVHVITDREAGIGPLMGIYSGLAAIEATHALVCAVDMPFVQPAIVSFLLAQAVGEEMIVPVVEQVPQVLLAVYPRSLLPLIEERLRSGRRDPRSLLEVATIRYIDEAQLRAIDPQLRSFVNVNTPQELRQCLAS
ncbi:MAG: molybdenum cofactor guanylyltransferase [Ktedonobacteraceae bacterium]|nr:molybdenum cofactor guanylyltransferase [Ktedonobacteraceae bacterium]